MRTKISLKINGYKFTVSFLLKEGVKSKKEGKQMLYMQILYKRTSTHLPVKHINLKSVFFTKNQFIELERLIELGKFQSLDDVVFRTINEIIEIAKLVLNSEEGTVFDVSKIYTGYRKSLKKESERLVDNFYKEVEKSYMHRFNNLNYNELD